MREGTIVDLLGVAFGRGARDPGCGDGPHALRRAGLAEALAAQQIPARWLDLIGDPAPEAPPIEAAAMLLPRLARTVESAFGEGRRLVVLGGDHSGAIGTWSGATRALRRQGPLGLIWIDAHLDAHTPETSHTGTLHGMPVAALLGRGDPRFTRIAGARPALSPRHLCIVGARDYEPEEPALLTRLGVRVIFDEEVERRGLDAALDEALAIARNGTAGFGLSIDIDAVDPRFAPGVGCPVPGGLDAGELVAGLARIRDRGQPAIVELAEFNPHNDADGRTERLALDLVAAALGGSRCIRISRTGPASEI